MTTTMKTKATVHGVLAGAYRGNGRRGMGAREDRALLTHASLDGGRTSLCKRVQEDSLCDVEEEGAPTCPVCAKRVAKL